MQTSIQIRAGINGTCVSIITVDENRDVQAALYWIAAIIGTGLSVVTNVRDDQVATPKSVTGVDGADIAIITTSIDDIIGTSCIWNTDIRCAINPVITKGACGRVDTQEVVVVVETSIHRTVDIVVAEISDGCKHAAIIQTTGVIGTSLSIITLCVVSDMEAAGEEVTHIRGTGESIATDDIIGCEGTAFDRVTSIHGTADTIIAVEVFRQIDAANTVLTGVKCTGYIVITVEAQGHGCTTHSSHTVVFGASLSIVAIGVIWNVLTVTVHMADIVGTWIGICADVILRREHAIICQATCVFCAVDAVFAKSVFREEEASSVVACVDGTEKAVITSQVTGGVCAALGLITGVCRTIFPIITDGVIQAVYTAIELITEVVGTVDAVYTKKVIGRHSTSLDRMADVFRTIEAVVTKGICGDVAAIALGVTGVERTGV